MLLPAVAMVRGAAHQVQCQNNLRQFGVAYAAYANDNEDVWPGIDDSVGSTFHWTYSVAPFLEFNYQWNSPGNFALKTYRCPSNDPAKITSSSSHPVNYATSYSMDQFSSVPPWVNNWRISRLPNLIRTGTARNITNWRLLTEMNLTYWWWSCDGTTAFDQSQHIFPHRGLCNELYGDGHVSTVTRITMNPWINWDNMQ